MPRKRRQSRVYSEVKRLLLATERVVEVQDAASTTSSTQNDSEKTPLLNKSDDSICKPVLKTEYDTVDVGLTVERVVLRRHVTLLNAVALIIGGVAGSGIFVSPTGVTANVGSVGSSLLIWTASGLFNLLCALCYAELGTALPVAGGDYAYLYEILGPVPAFLCLWTTTLLIAPCCAALMGRTTSAYFFIMFDIECSALLDVLLAVWCAVTCTIMNCLSVKWSSRLLGIFSVAKLLCLAVIIGVGIVKICQGHTEILADPFAGSKTDISSLVGGFLPGFIAYVGWDAVNNLAEEMENPKRDLPLSVTISMLVVTFIYVATNIAYFSVLTPAEFVASDAVATLFADKALGSIAFIIPVFVVMAAFGANIGGFLSYPRYAFAGAREHQLPRVFALVSLNHFTPIPAIILIGIASALFSAAIFFDIQALLDLTSVITMIKLVLTLVALLKLKWTQPDLPRTVKVPSILVLLSTILLVAILIVAVYQQPMVNGIGCLLFILGLPIYYVGILCEGNERVGKFFDNLTTTSQRLLLLVPGGKNA